MTENKAEIEQEIAELKAKIASSHEAEIWQAATDDGTRVVEIDPQDGLLGLMDRLDNAYERLQRVLIRGAYLQASGG